MNKKNIQNEQIIRSIAPRKVRLFSPKLHQASCQNKLAYITLVLLSEFICISNHLRLCLATAIHNLKWLEITRFVAVIYTTRKQQPF